MEPRPTVVGVCGSRRANSNTRAALQYALSAVEKAGGRPELLDLGAVDLPLYHPDRDEQGDSRALKRQVREADAVIVGSPVYHNSYSSTFKNFHDYCGSAEYERTPVALLACAGGSSFGSTLDHLRITVRGVYGHVVPRQVGIQNASDRFDESGALLDGDVADRLEEMAAQLVDYALMLRD